MKRLAFFIGMLLACNTLNAQKTVTKHYETSNVSEAFFHLKFAKNIEVKNWNKQTVKVVATVNLNENTDNDMFNLTEKRDGDILKIKSDYTNFFNRKKKSKGVINNDCDCCNHNKIEVNYTVYAPKKIKVKVKSISGNLLIGKLKNDVEARLVSGNINVKKTSKNMNLATVSGDIDVALKNAEFKAETVTGTVYSDLDIDFNTGRKKAYHNKIFGTVAKGTNKLRLKTVSGDVLLRKQ